MAKKLKKTLSLIMAIIMILCTLPVVSLAGKETDGYLTYEIINDKAIITDCDNTASGDYSIPSTLGGYPVKVIDAWAFSYCSDLTSITIPDGVDIYVGAFEGCSGITSITIPDSVDYIPDDTFRNCTNLKNIIISDNITSIGDNAFYNTAYYNDLSNWENGVLYIGNHLIKAEESFYGPYVIKDGTKCIAEEAFSFSGLTSITIPGSVVNIGIEAFEWCEGLENVMIGDGLKSIDLCAFKGCSSLTSITLPNSLTSIGDSAFEDCFNLMSITIPDGVKSIGNWAFEYCSRLTSITIPDGVTSIGGEAFDGTVYYNNLSNWENGVLYIGNHLIEAKDSISGAYGIKAGTKCIASGACASCVNLTDITIPDSVTSIGDYAFGDCSSLTSIIIPDSVTNIGESVFSGCSSLTDITIGNGVKSIGNWAFEDCSRLTSITIPDGVASIGDDAFYNCSSLTDITIGNGLTNIGYDAFYNCSNLTSVTIPNSVTNIKEATFKNCSNLTSIKIPDSVISIGNYAFAHCSKLYSVAIPTSVTCIGDYAFGYICEYKKIVDDEIVEIYAPLDNFTIYGYTGTAAEAYAIENGFKFIALDEEQHTHSYTSKITKAATCTEDGVKTFTCSKCDQTYTETIKATGHKLVTIPAVAATCSKTGKTAGKKCSVCGTVTVAQKTVAKKAHTYKTTTTKATTSKNGSVVTKCTVCGYVKSNVAIAKIKTVSLSKTSFTYNGKAQKPTVTVKDSNGKTLKNGTDYTVKYSSGCKNVGQYTVTVTFKGNYSGTKKLTFNIVPKGTSVSKLSAGKKQFTVSWKKQSTQTSGYEIQYSTSSKMKNAKTVTVKKNSTTSTTVKNLKSGKKYYVRVRTYKTVKINGKSVKLYSSWSSIKNIKTK